MFQVISGLASIAGFLIALAAIWKATGARRAVAEVTERNRRILLSQNVSQAIHTARLLLAQTNTRLWRVHRDLLREELAILQRRPFLSHGEQLEIRRAVVKLRMTDGKDESVDEWIRKTIEILIEIRQRLIESVMET